MDHPADPITERFYLVSEVADMARVAPDTVLQWIRSGRLPAVNIGTERKRLYRIPESAVIKLRAGQLCDGH